MLKKKIQDGAKIPRWQPCSHHRIYVGKSPFHASSVPFVLNPDTGYVSAQFHVVYDDWFATVTTCEEDLPDFNSKEWHNLFGESVYQYTIPYETEEDGQDAPNPKHENALRNRERVAGAVDGLF